MNNQQICAFSPEGRVESRVGARARVVKGGGTREQARGTM